MENLFDTVDFEDTSGSSISFGLPSASPKESETSTAHQTSSKSHASSSSSQSHDASSTVQSSKKSKKRQRNKRKHDADNGDSEDLISISAAPALHVSATPALHVSTIDEEEEEGDSGAVADAQKAEILALEGGASSTSKKRKLAESQASPASATSSRSSSSRASAESNPWLQPEAGNDGKESEKPSATTQNGESAAQTSKRAKKRRRRNKKKKNDDKAKDADLPDNIDIKDQMILPGAKGGDDGANGFRLLGSASEEQRKLIQRAFANAGTEEEEFEKEKEELHTRPTKKKKSGLDGWGSWTGFGVKKRKPQAKKNPKKQHPKKDPNRRDAKLKNVIISEKKDKKSAKYRLQNLPHPFENHKQYERALEQPLGRDWNTASAYSKLTQPEVVTRPGVAIAPLKFTETIKEAQQRSRAANDLQLHGAKKGKAGKNKGKKRGGGQRKPLGS